jgi:recombination protein RecR
MTVLDELIADLSKLPGIGRKSATRIAYHLLGSSKRYLESLTESISTLQERIKTCSVCGNYTEEDPCTICSNPARDRSVICVVEQSQDVLTIEATNEYKGLFHVLGGVISPLDGIGPDDLSFAELVRRVNDPVVKEIIIATNPTVEGDTTGLYVGRLLAGKDVRLSRLASGLPVGGDLEYADRLTLARSLKGRIPFSY